MVHRQKLKIESTKGQSLGVGDLPVLRAADPMLPDLLLDQGQGELRSNQGDVGTLPEQIWDGPDVVLVTVCENQRDNVGQPVRDRVQAGQNKIHARMIIFGKQHSAVDQ
jgi:hypothetical protein